MISEILREFEAKPDRFQEALGNPGVFCISWEQVPGRGAFEKQHEDIILACEKAAKGGRVHAVSVTDGPGGSPALAATMLGAEIQRLGIDPLVHFALRDANRIAVESLFYGLYSAGVRDLLIVSGDYPAKEGYQGQAGRVFDMDPTHVFQLVERMNAGLHYGAMGKSRTLLPVKLFAGAAFSPFKKLEAEVMAQYYKLGSKVKAGAKFLISQVGYDARKMQEPLLWLKQNGYHVPALANIYVLSHATARLMNRNGIPGCVVTDALLARLQQEVQSRDKGAEAYRLRAAKMYAIAKGLGYKGVHISGHNLSYEMVEHIIDTGEEMLPRWPGLVAEFDYPQKDGFYLFKKNDRTGLNTGEAAARAAPGRRPLIHVFSRLANRVVFKPGSLGFRFNRRVAEWLDTKDKLKRPFEGVESLVKGTLYGCLRCGDCSLPEMAYLCPVSQCPKGERLGACGGSFEGWCEVYPGERRCVWVKVYERLKAYGEEEGMKAAPPPRNWALTQTASWLNFLLGRDHNAKRLGIQPPARLSGGKGGTVGAGEGTAASRK
jgi:methylenetetrahydrofolate reductase (NADPH)